MAESSYMIAPGQTQADFDMKRKLAMMLAQKNMQAPQIDHWTQGLAHVAESGLGAHELARLDKQDRTDTAQGNELLLKYVEALRGGGAPAGANPAMTPPMGNSPMANALAKPTTGKIYSNDEPSPLDPPSGDDRDKLIRTVVAEAGNQGPQGMNAVASVVRNRAVNGGYGGDTPSGVVTAPKQFEPWNDMSGRARMASIDPNSPAYQAAGTAVDQAYAGNDPTNGALNFYSPKSQAALGRPAPSWDNGKGVDIGDHRFFGGAQQPGATPVQTAQAGGVNPALIQMLSNRKTAPMAQAILQEEIKKRSQAPEYEYKTRDDGAVVATNKRDPNDIRIVKPPGASEDLAKHAAGVEAAKKGAGARAEAQAAAQNQLPIANVKLTAAKELIEKARAHPGRQSFGGAGMSAPLAQFRPGSPAYDFKVVVDQLKGQSFLDAYESLKGGGPIANAEGEKAMAAMARLDRAQTPEAFDEALTDYTTALDRGFAALHAKAGVEQPAAQQGGAVIWERGPDGKPRRKQ